MNYMEQYIQWSTSPLFSRETREELKQLEHQEEEIKDRFYKELEFGTGGLRGVMGAGTNRMNIYTVRRATQGLSDYIKEKGGSARGVAIAYDSRHQSMEFARQAAMCLCGNGIFVHLFHQLAPTPLLSFAVRHLSLIAGIVITASHNPPEYNGYKVYWEDGAQITSQKDEEITQCIRQVRDYDLVRYMEEKEAEKKGLLQWIGPDMEEAYLEEIQKYVLSPDALKKSAKELTIVYTPLHGAGNLPVRHLLSRLGFSNVYVVKEQEEPDGNFSTVKDPNPEEAKVFELALKLAGKTKADLVFATDPDGDRMGVFVKEEQTGEYRRLNGNMSGILICSYLLFRRKELGLLPQNGVVIKTIVTTQMAKPLAEKYGMKLEEVLTGFKYIGALMRLLEDGDKPDYQFGFEESFGCLVETSVRDKDAVSAIMTLCEAAAFYKSRGSSILEELKKLYEEFGYYEECLETVTLKREDGIARMKHIMESFRSNPPQRAGGFLVIGMEDYETGKGIKKKLPKSNVLRFLMSGDSWFCIRPSGTEPKMKFYFGVKGQSFEDAQEKLEGLKNDILNRIGRRNQWRNEAFTWEITKE
ncbi:phospho-sugar mutase [Clostridium sp. E02]|uniref:phospho-sugar mutase n=1 Tax=Clostridium sp. E02 TaxID=2487134 RepID=UPI000F51CECA|nr:phospho-sugar mutase [Clostridium sp. E02]